MLLVAALAEGFPVAVAAGLSLRPLIALAGLMTAEARSGEPASAFLLGGRAHDLRDLLLHRLFAHAADAPLAQDAIPVHEEVGGNADDAVASGDLGRLVKADRVGETGALDVAANCVRVLSDIEREHDEPIALVRLVDFLDVRVFRPAGRAPGRPEVDPDGLAAEVAELVVLSVKAADAEVGRWLIDPRWRARGGGGQRERLAACGG